MDTSGSEYIGNTPGGGWGTTWGAKDETLGGHMQDEILLYYSSGPPTSLCHVCVDARFLKSNFMLGTVT